MLQTSVKVITSRSSRLTERKWFREGGNSFTTEGKIVYIFCWTIEDSIRIYDNQRSLIREFGSRFDEVKVFARGKWEWWIGLHPRELLSKIKTK